MNIIYHCKSSNRDTVVLPSYSSTHQHFRYVVDACVLIRAIAVNSAKRRQLLGAREAGQFESCIRITSMRALNKALEI